MEVVNTPSKELAFTNYAYVSAADLRRFPDSIAFVGDTLVLTLRYPHSVTLCLLALHTAHDAITSGQIGLNGIHSRQAKVSSGDSVTVSSFVPPEDFKLALLTLELSYVKAKANKEQLDAVLLARQLRKRFLDQVMTTGQKVTFEFCGINYIFIVNQALLEGQESSTPLDRGFLSSDTYIIFETVSNSGIKVINQKEAASSKLFKHKEFNLEKLGIGGLSAEFTDIFRRAFASRVFPPHVVSRLGIKHVKGILLYGPPGTGKTLMARQIGKLLNGKDPKACFSGLNISFRFASGMIDLDEALLRPGRLEVHIEINLPDENGRFQILQIHTNKMKESSFLSPDVNLQELAARTKNCSGAELEGVVKSAVSYALNRQISMDDLTKPLDEESIKVTMDDFVNGLQEITPAFGASTDNLERCRLRGIVDCGKPHEHIYKRAMLLVEQVKVSRGSPLVTCLLEGPAGSGKSATAATVGIDSDFAYVKVISAETMIGFSESSKCAQICKVFEGAYKSPLSIIILDDIERLLEYVAIGPRFSNLISQTLLVLLKQVPPKGKNLLVIGTTSEVEFLESIGMCDVFSVTYHVPKLKKEDAKKVLQHLNVFNEGDIDAAAEALDDMPLKKLYTLVEMTAQGRTGGSAEAIYAGKENIDIDHFFSILGDIIRH
ncbi:unnamed protein product [Urochloa decumbens]|uniref:Vesicle-fusing ATPase n=1 Tax=Urochloa decumbens TaxID=240449 RepID=A0ABC9AD84_9POAL